MRRDTISTIATDTQAEEHDHHEKIKTFAKILIAMECPYSAFSYSLKYLLGSKGSFLIGTEPDHWTFYANLAQFTSSVVAVGISVMVDSYLMRFQAYAAGNTLCFAATALFFITIVSNFKESTRLLMNMICLFWMFAYFVIEPIRVALFFDQLPDHMEPHQAGHVFLMYQEMKTLGSLLYIGLAKIFKSRLAEVHIGLGITFTVVPLFYWIIILSFAKNYNPGGSSMYMGVECISCFIFAIRRRFFGREKSEGHWLDIAREAFDSRTVRNTKIMCSVIFIYMALMSYGMTLILLKNTWSDQTKNLIEDLKVKKYYVDINFIYFVLTIVFLPIIEYLLVPIWSKYRKPLTELQKIGITVFLTGFSFIATTILQLQIEKHTSLPPSSEYAQVRIFNTSPYRVNLSGDWNYGPIEIPAKGMIEAWNIDTDHNMKLIQMTIVSIGDGEGKINYTGFIFTKSGESLSFIIDYTEIFPIKGIDPILFGPPGTNDIDQVRVYLINYYFQDTYQPLMEEGSRVHLNNEEYSVTINVPSLLDRYIFQVYPGTYKATCEKNFNISCNSTLTFDRGGLYAVLPFLTREWEIELKAYIVVAPAVYNVFVMIPQIAILSFAEAMGKIPINLFIFKESPAETRTISLALYYFSRDGTSIIFAVFSDVFRAQVDSFQLVLVTGIHMVFCFVFVYAALRFQRYRPEEDKRRGAILRKEMLI